jgi:cell division protein ZapA (FtsZ GTPase activity inhibitor)
MNEPYRTTLVKIMGDEYPIKSDADADYLQKLAKYVEEKILSVNAKGKLPQQLKREILAAILIADDYFIEKEKNEKIEGRMQQLVSFLEENLNKEH